MNVIVFGGSGGIGSALVLELAERFPDARLFATWHSNPPQNQPELEAAAQWARVDLQSEASIESYTAGFNEVHWIINAAGMLHDGSDMPEKSLQQVDPEFFIRSMQVNSLPVLLIAKHLKAALRNAARQEQTVQFATVSAKVGSIEDNGLGGWYSYRCSKAALNMAVKNLSIEWRRTLPSACVTALHPGTTDTSLSAPFQRNVPDGKLFAPLKTAGFLIELMSRLTPSDSGKFLAYDGQELPW